MQKERKQLWLDVSHLGLLIMDIFRGPTTTSHRNLLASDEIYFSKVPANMTKLY